MQVLVQIFDEITSETFASEEFKPDCWFEKKGLNIDLGEGKILTGFRLIPSIKTDKKLTIEMTGEEDDLDKIDE